ncbi:MAG: hypothetical protein ACFFAH_10970 [Promethearchaeota archaeon]
MEYIKICGLKNFEDVRLCVDNGANALGFIYNVPDSPRNLKKSEILKILNKIPNNINTVVVFKPSNIDELLKIIDLINVNLYQIHCKFNSLDLDKIPNELKNKIVLALKANYENKEAIIKKINKYKLQFFAFLIDNSEGHGNKFDFDLIKEILDKTNEARIILAGGIDIHNAEKIMKDLKPYGIDVSSSLEIEKGVKDPKKIKDFLIKMKELKNLKRD